MTTKVITLIALSLVFSHELTQAEEPVYPLKVSGNRRTFVDQIGNPVFWLGTTQWQLFREYRLEEARLILEKTKSRGFAFAQVMLMGVGDGTQPNVHGEKPWHNNDPLNPNDGYFKHVDRVMRVAREKNIVISMTVYHQRYRKYITLDNARQWAQWVAQRYKVFPNIVWSMTPQAKQEYVPVLRELALGLRQGDGGSHLITFKPDPAPFSSSFIHEESWLDFDSVQTWNRVDLIYPLVTRDYNLKPVKPVLMAEGAYERGSEYGFEVSPLWIRRQAYYSCLAGAHHTYGHNDSWRVLPRWKEALDAPGAVQLGILKRIFQERKEWWLLVPDQTILVSGGITKGKLLNLAARHEEGTWVMAYMAEKASVSIDMTKIASAGRANAFWVDPRNGEKTPVGSVLTTGTRAFSTPKEWEDALLILEASSKDGPLAALPSKPGPHLEKIKALKDNAWLELGPPAADPKWGRARGRSWTSEMPLAPELRGAFLQGEGQHGYTKPNGHYMDDLWFYDINAHRWICCYPGAPTKTLRLKLNEDGFEVSPAGEVVPVAQQVHGYEMNTYDTEGRRLVSMPNTHSYWHRAIPQRTEWLKRPPADASPWFYETTTGKWSRLRTGTSGPPTGCGDTLIYLLDRHQAFFLHRNSEVWIYDTQKNTWKHVEPGGPLPPFGIDATSCYDSRRHRIYIGGGSYPVAPSSTQAFWIYDLAKNTWIDPKPKGSPCRGSNSYPTKNAVMVYDPSTDRVLLVFHSFHDDRPERLGVYVYDPTTNAWAEEVHGVPEKLGHNRQAKNGFYDPHLGVVFLHSAGDSRDDSTIWVYRYRRVSR